MVLGSTPPLSLQKIAFSKIFQDSIWVKSFIKESHKKSFISSMKIIWAVNKFELLQVWSINKLELLTSLSY